MRPRRRPASSSRSAPGPAAQHTPRPSPAAPRASRDRWCHLAHGPRSSWSVGLFAADHPECAWLTFPYLVLADRSITLKRSRLALNWRSDSGTHLHDEHGGLVVIM